MSDDLAERLRASTNYDDRSDAADLIEAQAARIAELEAALQRIIENEDQFRMTCAAVIARAALEGGKDG